MDKLKLLKIKKEKNDLICEFMETSEIPYSASWDFLMDAWVKIGELKSDKFVIDDMEIRGTKCCMKAIPTPYSGNSFIAFNMIGDTHPSIVLDLKTAVFESIVDFIVWYNEITK